ncbi:MAG: MFS transporter [Spirochaetes bacterium]|nr:MFS transporter [Spirochaetota bacterium]
MIRNPKTLTASSFLCMFFIGIGTTVAGAAARNIGLSPSQIGLLFAVQNVGFIISVSIAGVLADTMEKPRILLVSGIVLLAAFALFYNFQSFLVNLLVMFFIGVGMGGFEGVTDAMLLDLHDEKESLYITVNHFFVTFGSLMITLYLVFLQMNWRRSLVQSSVAIGCLAVLFLFSKLESNKTAGPRLKKRLSAMGKDRLVFSLFAAGACIVGCELGTQAVLTTFLMDLRGFSQVTSKLGLIGFLAGIACGRLFIGLFTKKQHIYRFALLLLLVLTVLYSVLFFVDTNGGLAVTSVLIFFCGLMLSAVFPIILSLAGILYKNMAGTVLGIVKMGIPIGGIFIPLFMSVFSRFASFGLSLALFPIASLASFLILFSNRERFRAHDL